MQIAGNELVSSPDVPSSVFSDSTALLPQQGVLLAEISHDRLSCASTPSSGARPKRREIDTALSASCT